MPDLTRKVSPGDLIVIPAAVWNELLDTARHWRRTKLGTTGGGTPGSPIVPAVEVLVKNTTDGDLAALSVLSPSSSAIVVSPVDEPYLAGRRPTLEGAAPSSTGSPVVILLEPVAAGAIGRAVIGGVAVVTVNVSSGTHTHARPTASNTARLESAATGPARILWREDGSSGDKLAVVVLNNGGPAGGSAATQVRIGKVSATFADHYEVYTQLPDEEGGWVDDAGPFVALSPQVLDLYAFVHMEPIPDDPEGRWEAHQFTTDGLPDVGLSVVVSSTGDPADHTVQDQVFTYDGETVTGIEDSPADPHAAVYAYAGPLAAGTPVITVYAGGARVAVPAGPASAAHDGYVTTGDQTLGAEGSTKTFSSVGAYGVSATFVTATTLKAGGTLLNLGTGNWPSGWAEADWPTLIGGAVGIRANTGATQPGSLTVFAEGTATSARAALAVGASGLGGLSLHPGGTDDSLYVGLVIRNEGATVYAGHGTYGGRLLLTTYSGGPLNCAYAVQTADGVATGGYSDPDHPEETLGLTFKGGLFTGGSAAITGEMVTDALGYEPADTDSPALTGTPTAPTAAAGTDTTQLATTEFVQTELDDYAETDSPALTGTPTAPTATAGTSTTQVATTAFVGGGIADALTWGTWP